MSGEAVRSGTPTRPIASAGKALLVAVGWTNRLTIRGPRLLLCMCVLLVAFTRCSAAGPEVQVDRPVVVAEVLDETGQRHETATLGQLRTDLRDALRAEGFSVPAVTAVQPGLEVRPRLIRCSLRGTADSDNECLSSVAVFMLPSHRLAFETVVRTSRDAGVAALGAAMASAVGRGLHLPAGPEGLPGEDITATGAAVRDLGAGRFMTGDEVIDLHAIRHAHDPAIDPDVPMATNVTLNDTVAVHEGPARNYAVITLYQIDPPLTGEPSREPGVDRGTDFRDPANLVKAAYTNYVSPVLTDDPVPVRVASHPIGHFLVKVEVPGYPTIMTGMTTIARADRELVDLTLARELGVGGVLLIPEPGRLNSAAEVIRELSLRQRRLHVVDGLYFHRVRGRNAGPEYTFDDGRAVFLRVKLPVRNAKDALAYFVEYIHRGEHNRFGSLENGPFKGTGAGCAAFAMSWLQAAGVIPFITQPPPQTSGPVGEEPDAGEFWRATRARLHIPWRLIGCDERVGASRIVPAQLTVYDLLFHNESADFVRAASHGLAEQVRASYGSVAATLFQIGALTPLRDLVIDGRRKDPRDRGDYTWSGPGIDIDYWDNSRFSAWIHRLWTKGPHDPHLSLAREGRFFGVEIDAMAAPRQAEPLFAAADRINAQRAIAMTPALSCEEVFDRGLE
jgi:hypothetical protein